ncbi:MAG: GNAT family N-acetyltransferase [Rhodospirillaceae bacterium]
MLIVRKLRSDDRDFLARHLMRLDSYDRRCRFGAVISDDEIIRYCQRTVGKTSISIGVFRDGEIRASVELQPDACDHPKVAELAFSVAKDLQEMGLGSSLMRRALIVAQNIGIEKVVVVSMRENHKMKRLAQKFGGKSVIGRDEVVSTIALPSINYGSIIQEAIDDNLAIIATIIAPANKYRIFKFEPIVAH